MIQRVSVQSIAVMLVCYPQLENQILDFPSGVVSVCDPANSSGEDFQVALASQANVFFLHTDSAPAGLEIRFREKPADEKFVKAGVVGVDSAKIVIGDKKAIDESPDQGLFLSTGNEAAITKIQDEFKIHTRRLCDDTTEIVTDDPVGLHEVIGKFVKHELGLDPGELLFLHDEDAFWERCVEASWDGGFFHTGTTNAYIFNTGSDGNYDVFTGLKGDQLSSIWIVANDDLVIDGFPDYLSRPFETLPPPKPISEMGAAILTGNLAEYLERQKKPWWKFW